MKIDVKVIIQGATIVIGAVAYTVTAYSWMTNTFTAKDTFTILLQKVDSVDHKLDILIEKHIKEGSDK